MSLASIGLGWGQVAPWRLSLEEMLHGSRGLIWRFSSDTLVFEGKVHEGLLGDFISIAEPGDRKLIVRSPGGSAHAGVLLGLELARRQWPEVEVDTICASSCANYIFTAGTQKMVRPDAWVGFHGNSRAYLHQIFPNAIGVAFPSFSGDSVAPLVRSALRSATGSALGSSWNPSDEDVEIFYERVLSDALLEWEFCQRTGISQELFERTQRPDKGFIDHVPPVEADFLVPSVETLHRYGIHRVTSRSDWMPERALFRPRRTEWRRAQLIVE